MDNILNINRNPVESIIVPKNVIDGNIIKNVSNSGFYNSKSNPLKTIKAVYSDLINSIKKDIEFKQKSILLVKKRYEDRIQYINNSRLSEIEKLKAIRTLEINLSNELKIISNQIDNLIKEQQNKSSAYLIRENSKKYISKRLSYLSPRLEFTRSVSNILKAHLKIIEDNVKLVISDKKQLIVSLVSMTSLILTRINLKNYKIDTSLSEIEKEIDIIYYGDISDPEVTLSSIKTKINVAASKITIRERNLVKISNILDILQLIIAINEILFIAITLVIEVLPGTPPIAVGGNILNKLQKAFEFIQSIIIYINLFLSAIRLIIDLLLRDIQYQKDRLYTIFSLFETAIISVATPNKNIDINNPTELNSLGRLLNSLNPNQFNRLLNGNSTYGLGYLEGLDYNGFRFYLREENNINFIVRGYKRRYAVALDSLDREVIQSDYSFTLEPEVLVEQIKVEIDLKGLTP